MVDGNATPEHKENEMADFYTDPQTGVVYYRDHEGILRPRRLTNAKGETVGYAQAEGFFPNRVQADG